MAQANLLEDIERKTQEIMRSNDELASKLRKSQETISVFNKELELLKSSGPNFESSVRIDLERMKSDLEEKRQLLANLIDDLEPLELDLAKKEDVINLLAQRVDDQTAKLESVSKQLVDSKSQLQRIIDEDSGLKKQLAEKEALLKVTKDRLSEKTTLLKELDEKNRRMEQELDSSKRQLFAFNNKMGAIEGRVFSTGEQNQKLLAELMRMKERSSSVESALAEKDRLLEANSHEFSQRLELLRKEEDEKRLMLMQNHSKKVAAMNAAISLLKAKLEQQSKVVEQRSAKEQAMISEFNARMRELLLTKPEDLSQLDLNFQSPEPEPEPAYNIEEPKIEDSGVVFPSKLDEIMPVIEMALDHGDSLDQVRHSLLSSGYSKRDIEEAISKLDIVENK